MIYVTAVLISPTPLGSHTNYLSVWYLSGWDESQNSWPMHHTVHLWMWSNAAHHTCVCVMTGICLFCPAAWLVLIRRCQSARGLSCWHTHTNTHAHTYVHYPRADRGYPAKAGLPLVINIRSCPHSPHDPPNMLTHKYLHQTNQMNTGKHSAAAAFKWGMGSLTSCMFCLQFQIRKKNFMI